MDLSAYKDIVDNANDLIQSVAPDGRIKFVNTAWVQTLGYSEHDLSSITIFDIIHPDEIEHCHAVFGRVMSGEDVGLVTTRFVTHNGRTVYVEGNVNCHFEDGKPVFTRAIFRDITKLIETERIVKRLYEEEKALREKLEDEMQQKAEFSRILVHELKTPLTSIMGLVELLKLSKMKPPYDRAINSLNRSSDELNKRISELLELTRAEVGELKIRLRKIRPDKLITEIIHDCELIAQAKKIKLRGEVHDDLPSIKADRNRLRQVIQNIIDNAIKATPQGGEIIVNVFAEEGNLTIQVRDTGHGIGRKDLANIFEPYFRVSGVAEGYEGMGLGLTLSKRIVELHGGRIWVESQEGKGSTFSISIPVAK